jgi:hypothetical protein
MHGPLVFSPWTSTSSTIAGPTDVLLVALQSINSTFLMTLRSRGVFAVAPK